MRWQRRAENESERRENTRWSQTELAKQSSLLDLVLNAGFGPTAKPVFASSGRRRVAPAEFAARRIERSLSASRSGIGPASLGVRSSVVRLELLRDDALPAGAVIAPTDVAADDALRTALTPTGEEDIVARAVVQRNLLAAPLPVLDSCPSRAERQRASRSSMPSRVRSCRTRRALARSTTRARASATTDATVEFPPLVCPNCGWDLPVEPAVVAFACAGCDRAWLVAGEDLLPQPTTVAAPPAGIHMKRIDHRPFWEIPVAAAGGPPALGCVPAFRHGNLRRLRDLALRLSRRRGSFVAIPPGAARLDLGGCVLDPDDAAAIAALPRRHRRRPARALARRSERDARRRDEREERSSSGCPSCATPTAGASR